MKTRTMFPVRPAWLVLTALAISFASYSSAEAQWLRVGPFGGVRLRVPLVSVDVGPGGATSVRAPFTAVDTPGYPYAYASPYYGGPAVAVGHPALFAPHPVFGPAPLAGPAPLFGTAGPMIAAPADRDYRAASPPTPSLDPSLSNDQLLQELAASGDALAQALAQRQGGDVWIEFLRPHQLAALAQQGDTASLTRVLQGYEGTQANNQLAWLGTVTGFRATQAALRAWLQRQASTGDAPQNPAASPSGGQPTPAAVPQDAIDDDGAESIPVPEPEAASIRIEA